MKHSSEPPRYLAVAVDIARRVSAGEFSEGQSLPGNSLLASQYETSPETIRRSLGLLSEMGVVEVRPQSGTRVVSVDNADEYISYFEKDVEVRKTYDKICDLMREYDKLNKAMMKAIDTFADRRMSMISVNAPLPNYKIVVPEGSAVIGKSIGDLKFWGVTGCTIVAVERGGEAIVSPGPFEQLAAGDGVLVVGPPSCVERATRMIEEQA